jgi:Protein of unknown function (DUF3987)/Bifunctional DNA primase/polymerase, N-terminal
MFTNSASNVNENCFPIGVPSVTLQPTTEVIPPQILKALQRGWEVFPLRPRTKTGYYWTVYKDGGEGYSWQKQATNNIDQVRIWAAEFPGCNWGSRTGETSGFFVTDLDTPEALQRLKALGAKILYLVRTGHKSRDRYQAYFLQPEGVRIKTDSDIFEGDPEGFDVRGDKNGYVVLPPSIHPDGFPYEIVEEAELLEEPTQELLHEVTDNRVEEPAVDISDLEPLTDKQKELGRSTFLNKVREYQEYLETTDIVTNDSNDRLNILAGAGGKRVARELFTLEEVIEKIEAASAIYIAYDRNGYKGTLRSGLKHGLRHPWTPDKAEQYLKEKGEREANLVGFGKCPMPAAASPVPQPPAPAVKPSEPIERGLPKLAPKSQVEPFPTHVLGPVLQAAAEAIARRVQCVPDIAAHSVLSGAALAVCPHYNVQLPFGSVSPVNLFLMTVGRSGDRKTSADKEAMVCVGEWERELEHAWKRDMPHYEAQLEHYEKQQKQAFKDRVISPAQVAEALGPKPKPPVSFILRCDEPTIEGLRDVFLRGSNLLGLYGDEGGKFLGGHSMKEEHQLNAITSLSSMWDGTEIRKVRAGNEVATKRVYRLATHLMMQPGVAERFLGNGLYQEQGILARYLVAWPELESMDGQRFFVEPDPNYDEILQPYRDRVFRLLSTPHPENQWGELDPMVLPFSAGARKLWIKYQNESQAWMAPKGRWKPIRAFGEKALEHAARLAVVLQQFNSCSLELSAEYFEAGWQLVQYYANQLLATQGVVRDPEIDKAHILYQWLEEKHEGDIVDSRTIQRKGPAPCRNKKALEQIVGVLVEFGLLEPLNPGDPRWKVYRGY